jgi:hypothetical protein
MRACSLVIPYARGSPQPPQLLVLAIGQFKSRPGIRAGPCSTGIFARLSYSRIMPLGLWGCKKPQKAAPFGAAGETHCFLLPFVAQHTSRLDH